MDETIPSSGITAKTHENIMLGTGTIHKGLKYEGGKWNFVESLFCATSGGGSVNFSPELLDLDIDGATVKFVGGTLKVGESAKMKFKSAEITPEIIKKSIFAKEVTDNKITGYTELVSKPQIEKGDFFEYLAYVGKKIDGTPIIVIFDKALCTSGLSVEGENKKMVVPELEFECYAEEEQADKSVLPYHIYYPTAVAA
ncbi:hypothetical protein [Catenibacterium sp.]|uniref:hypothetical protein n=1 Tax=Catenibacterium sp. TaxID=2049022 RepID=UPI003AB7AAD8